MIASPSPAVEIDRISKRYGETLALDDVAFAVARGGLFVPSRERAGRTYRQPPNTPRPEEAP